MEELLATWWIKAGGVGVLAVILFAIVKKIYADMREDKASAELRDVRREADAAEKERQRLLDDARARADMTSRIRELENANLNILTKVVTDNTSAQRANADSRKDLDQTMRLLVDTLNRLPCNRALPDTQLPYRTPRP